MTEKIRGLDNRKAARLINRAKKMQVDLEIDFVLPSEPQAKIKAVPGASAELSPSSNHPTHDKAIEVKMRSLIDAGSDWNDIRELAALWLEVSPTAERAAFCFDVCALTGEEADLISWIERWEALGKTNFWPLAQPEVRDHVILRLWNIQKGKEQLRRLLLPLREQVTFSDIENFAVFNFILQSAAKKEVLLYFREHGQGLLQTLATHAKLFGHSVPAFLLHMGTIAMNLGVVDLARQLLEMIRADQIEYNDAADLLMKLKYKDGASEHAFSVKMAKLVNWEDKLTFLGELLEKVQDADPEVLAFRPEVNALIEDTFAYLPESESVNTGVATLLGSYLKVSDAVPNVFLQIYSRRNLFTTPDLDRAFWRPISQLQSSDQPAILLQQIAKIRIFLADGLGGEPQFWAARPQLLLLDGCKVLGNQRFLLQEWRDALHMELSQSQYLRTAGKSHILAILKALTPADRVALYDLESLINVTALDSLAVIDQLIEMATERRSDTFEYKLRMQRAKRTHLRNLDLERLWALAISMEVPDLAWRVATVMQARHILRQEVAHTRDVCGVDLLPPMKPNGKEIPKIDYVSDILSWFDPYEALLIRFYQHVGPQLPLLVKILDPKAKQNYLIDSKEDRQHTKLIAGIKKKIQDKLGINPYDKVPLLSHGPHFAEGIPHNSEETGIVYRLIANSFGLASTGYSLQSLSDLIDDRFPLLSGKRYAKVKCSKTEHWFKHLNSDAKSSFTALRGRIGDYPDARTVMTMQKFTLILTLLVTGDHTACLKLAQSMRLRLGILRDLEQFIVSPIYEEFRVKHGRLLNIPIPGSITRMDRILIQPG